MMISAAGTSRASYISRYGEAAGSFDAFVGGTRRVEKRVQSTYRPHSPRVLCTHAILFPALVGQAGRMRGAVPCLSAAPLSIL
jgi:hypothetical protein